MERHLDEELGRVRQQILRMGGETESMLERVMQALVERDGDLAREVHRRDRQVDELEIAIDRDIYSIMARQQPTAIDLRFLIAATRIIHELERVGDSAKNIAESVLEINDQPPLKPYVDLPRMSDLAVSMVRDSLDAFTRGDAVKARGVIVRDEQIDDLFDQISRELVTYMVEDPKTITRALEVLQVANNLERVADHATNIAEDVVFLVEATDIRHNPPSPDEIESPDQD